MNTNIIALPQRGTTALPRRGYRPQTAVEKIKARLDPLTMARLAGVLAEGPGLGGDPRLPRPSDPRTPQPWDPGTPQPRLVWFPGRREEGEHD